MARTRATLPTTTIVKRETLGDGIGLDTRFGDFGGKRSANGGATWSLADAMELFSAIAAVVGSGDAIMFGRTRDGGALVCTVLHDNDRRKWYPTDAASIGSCLRQIEAAYLPVQLVDPATKERRK